MSPPSKVRKTEQVKMKEKSPDGVIRFEFNNVAAIMALPADDITDITKDHMQHSPVVTVKGVPWNASVLYYRDLVLSFECMRKEEKAWSIDVDAEFIICNSDQAKNCTVNIHKTFNNENNGGWIDLVKNNSFNQEGFIVDDKITLEVRFWISNLMGFSAVPRIDFSDAKDPRQDLTFVINGEKVYVNKAILAFHSRVFNAMLFGEFSEKNKDEIELKDVDRQEFVDLLHLIYPSNEKITDISAEYLLHLADRFDMASVVDRIEDYIITSAKIHIVDKFRIADKYRLFALREHCFTSLKSKTDYTRIKESAIFRDFSDATKLAFFERHFELFE